MRKEIDIVITEEGRDHGKLFHIREMPASQAEKWAMRALMALTRSGTDIGEIGAGGMQHLAILGMQALTKLTFDEAEPLLDEMMTCVTIKPDPTKPNIVRPLMEDADDIEEVATRLKLRWEVFQLHVGFSNGGAGLRSSPASPTNDPDSSSTPTSPQPSVRFSQSARTKRPR